MKTKTTNEQVRILEMNIKSNIFSEIVYQLLDSEFSRYLAVSVIAFILDLSAFSASIHILDLPWVMAATIGFLIGLAVAYILSILFVFTNRTLRKTPFVELMMFSLVGLGGLSVTQMVLWLGIEHLNFNPEISKFFAAGLTFLFNFVVRKLILFSTVAQSTHNR